MQIADPNGPYSPVIQFSNVDYFKSVTDDDGNTFMVRAQSAEDADLIVRDNVGSDGTIIVRDHRHPEGCTNTVCAPPAAPPPAVSSGVTGTDYTSAEDYQRLRDANSSFEAAEKNALAN